MALSAAERQRKRYHENPEFRARKIAQVKAYARRHRERLRAKRHTPEFRAKHAAYARMWKLVDRMFEEWRYRRFMDSRRAA